MKKIYKNGLVALIAVAMLASCKKEGTLNANLDILDKNVIEKTAVDDWLDQNYLNPYNIEVKYKFDRYELDLGKNITPPLEEQVIPAMETVRDVWIKPFETIGGATFIKRISPKQFVLAGSASYNEDGTITLGTAEGGRKIVLYVINSFDPENLNSVKQMIQVIQHEYTHILNQTVDYQPDYQTISRGGYVANWTQETLTDARAAGFITQYARSAPGEDFAEMSSNMLMMGRVVFDAQVLIAPADGQAKLRKKEQYVVDYFKSAFNIDFYALQTEVQKALSQISTPRLVNLLGPGAGYTSLYSRPGVEPNQSADFLATWNAANTRLRTTQGYGLNDLRLNFKGGNILTATYTFSTISGVINTYTAEMDYAMTIFSDGTVGLTPVVTQPTTVTYSNMGVIRNSIATLNTWFTGRFRLDWVNPLTPGQIAVKGSLAAFYKQDNPNSYFYGTLGQ
jgi:substrate import-associated zinc metallohydrolase lipoprotein